MPDLELTEEEAKKMRSSFVLVPIPVPYHLGAHPLLDPDKVDAGGPDAANFHYSVDAYAQEISSVLRVLYGQSGHHLDAKAGDITVGAGTQIRIPLWDFGFGFRVTNAGPEGEKLASNPQRFYGGGAPVPREMADASNPGVRNEDTGDLETVAALISRINVEVRKADANLQDAVATLKRIEEL